MNAWPSGGNEFEVLFSRMSTSGCQKKQIAAGGWLRRKLDGHEEFAVMANTCEFVGKVCPRLDLPTGVGYDLCKAIHAEARLVELLGLLGDGWEPADGVLFVAGHYYACEPCASAAKRAGFREIRVRETL